MNALQIEIALARMFNYRQNLMVPNVWWGFGLRYEADLVVVRPSGWMLEIEIKVTSSDIRADLKKKILHDDRRFKQLYFAVPEALENHADIPMRAGIISVKEKTGWAHIIRGALLNKNAEKISAADKLRLLELGVMRVWSLKMHRSAPPANRCKT